LHRLSMPSRLKSILFFNIGYITANTRTYKILKIVSDNITIKDNGETAAWFMLSLIFDEIFIFITKECSDL